MLMMRFLSNMLILTGPALGIAIIGGNNIFRNNTTNGN